MTAPVILLADLGATNARFALLEDGCLSAPVVLPVKDFATPEDAFHQALTLLASSTPPQRAVIAVAAAVLDDRVDMTNCGWHFSAKELSQKLNIPRLQVINDFLPVAAAAPQLAPSDIFPVNGNNHVLSDATSPVAVFGPGSGLGVSYAVPTSRGWQPFATEGGHITLSPETEREWAVVSYVRTQTGTCSAERLLSGPGFVNLYRALAFLEKREPQNLSPADIVSNATTGKCSLCRESLDMFCALLGSFGGNLALTLGAQGGVFIAGGIVPRFTDFMSRSSFRSRFESKGRLSGWLQNIPVNIVLHPAPAFPGLVAMLENGLLD